MSLIKSAKTLIIIVIILITSTSVSNNALSSISTLNDTTELAFGDRILPTRQSNSESSTQHPYSSPSKSYRRRRQNQNLRHLPALLGDDKKRKLAKIMKERYLEFRRKLEQSKEEIDPYSDPPLKDASVQLLPRQSPEGRPIYVPSFFESSKIHSNKNSGPVAIQSSKSSPFNMAKKLRSADEATSSSRSSGIRPGSHPFVPLIRPINTSGSQASQRASETATQNVLDERLGPSARPTYDPSIVVDFYSLLQATRQTHGLSRSNPDGRLLRTHLDSHSDPKLLIQSESSEEIKVVRRKLHHEPVRDRTRISSDRTLSSSEQNFKKLREHKPAEEADYEDYDESSEQTKSRQETIRVKHSSSPSTSSEPKSKRAQLNEPFFEKDLGTSDRLQSFKPFSKTVSPDKSLPSDRLRVFKPLHKIISQNESFLEKEIISPERKTISEPRFNDEHIPEEEEIHSSYEQTWSEPKFKRAQFLQLPSNVGPNSTMDMSDLSLYISTASAAEHETSTKRSHVESEFGPHSDGNDPKAGVDPSQVSVPNIDLSTIHLPQGVRDSLRKYLKPLISTLKPLRKSVPGLPGLDYPILSVVPYTNFYCSNMPWPGFYADTEARCQTWHACDVDGRQSTFLCPNGTIFNQALMVCDWWYNADCLAAPFLYPLNERLFGDFKPEPVTPYTRITPELLDTIFTK